jgi:hypothetical protein
MTARPGQWAFLTEVDYGMDVAEIRKSFADHVEHTQGKDEFSVTPLDFF